MRRSEVETLARLLDGEAVAGEQISEQARALAALGSAMQASAVRPRAEFRSDLRAQLIDQARAQAASPGISTRVRHRVSDVTARWRYSTRLAAASGAAAVALSGGGVAAAAQHALPGEALYPVKVAIEDVRLALTRDVVDRAERQLGLATERAEEAALAVAGGDQDAGAQALRSADSRTRDGAQTLLGVYQEEGRASVLVELGEFAAAQRSRIQAMGPQLTGTAVVAASDALVVLDRIDARVAALLDGCVACPAAGAGFDYSYIPPATEPFDPCPCVQDEAEEPTGPAPVADEDAGSESPPPSDASQPSPDEPRASQPDGQDPGVTVPDVQVRTGNPLEGTTRAAEDATRRVVDDVIKRAVEQAPADLEEPVRDLGEAVEDLLP